MGWTCSDRRSPGTITSLEGYHACNEVLSFFKVVAIGQ